MGSKYSKGEMIALGAVFSVVPIVATSLRFWARALTRARYGMEDYLIIGAALSAVATNITIIIGACIGEMGQHQRQVSDSRGNLVVDGMLRNYEKSKFSIQLLGTLSFGLSKLSVVFLCRRIFATKSFRLVANGYIVFLVCWTISFVLATLFQCTPISIVWTRFEYNYANSCIKIKPLFYASAVTDAFTDIAILVLPIPMVWKLQLPWKQRVAIGGMFLLGILVLATSLTRVGIFITIGKQLAVNSHDSVYYSSPVLFWGGIESSLSVLSACLPTMRPLLKRGQHITSHSNSGSNRTALSIKNKNLKHHRLEGEADSVSSSAGLRGGQTGTAGMGVNTHVQSLPLQGLQPEARNAGIWVEKDMWNSTGRRAEFV